jgi:DNA-binding NarL/FixJ family response regulator
MGHEAITAVDVVGTVAHLSRTSNDPLSNSQLNATLDRSIALIEGRTFMRDCIHRGLRGALPLSIRTFASLSDLRNHFDDSIALFFLSLSDSNKDECASAIKALLSLDSNIPIVVLSTGNDRDLIRAAVHLGAKGYIPYTTNFEVVIEAVRFILAGGTYVPVDYLFAPQASHVSFERQSSSTSQFSSAQNVLTDRERSVVQAIQEGKSNKVIAYKLCICEGTVKVHLRNIMKKLNAKNRTEVAIKAQTSLGLEIGQLTQL